MHDFHWAMEELKAGRRVRRTCFGPGAYIWINEHNIMLFHLGQPYKGMFGDGSRDLVHHLHWLDIRLSDWEHA